MPRKSKTLEERMQKALRLVEGHRQSHVNWVDYYTEYPQEEGKVYKSPGDMQTQKRVIRKYDYELAVFRQALKELEGKKDG
jgi:hypothetical protein